MNSGVYVIEYIVNDIRLIFTKSFIATFLPSEVGVFFFQLPPIDFKNYGIYL